MDGKSNSHFSVFRRAKGGAHKEAVLELVTISWLTAIPFFIGAFSYLLTTDTGSNYSTKALSYLGSVFLQGQLFLLSVSYIATSLHRLWNSDQSYRRPDGINVFAILLFGIIGAFYGNNPEFTSTTSLFARYTSVIFVVISIVFYYYTAVLSYDRPKSIEQTLKVGAKDLSERVARRRKAPSAQGSEA